MAGGKRQLQSSISFALVQLLLAHKRHRATHTFCHTHPQQEGAREQFESHSAEAGRQPDQHLQQKRLEQRGRLLHRHEI